MSENEYHDYADGSECYVDKCPFCNKPYEYCRCEED